MNRRSKSAHEPIIGIRWLFVILAVWAPALAIAWYYSGKYEPPTKPSQQQIQALFDDAKSIQIVRCREAIAAVPEHAGIDRSSIFADCIAN